MLASVGMPARVGVFLPGPDQGLQDRVLAVRDGRDFQHRQRRVRGPDVAGELRHRVARVACSGPRAPGRSGRISPSITTSAPAMHRWSTVRHLASSMPRPADGAGHGQLVEPVGGVRRLEGRGQEDRRIQAHVHRHRQPLAQRLGLGPERVDVPARCEEDRQLVAALHAHAMDGDVGPLLRVAAEQQSQAEVRPGVDGGVRRGRAAACAGRSPGRRRGGRPPGTPPSPGPRPPGRSGSPARSPCAGSAHAAGSPAAGPLRSRLAINPTRTRQPG